MTGGSNMKLPIDLVPGTNPPVFKWVQTVETIGATAVQECEGMLPPSCERAVEALVTTAKELLKDNAMLMGQLEAARRRTDQLDREAQQRVAAAAPLKPTNTTTTTATTNKK